jgi:hypothetical protein
MLGREDLTLKELTAGSMEGTLRRAAYEMLFARRSGMGACQIAPSKGCHDFSAAPPDGMPISYPLFTWS